MHEDRVVSFRLNPDTLTRLSDAARKRNCSPADLIRAALASFLSAAHHQLVPSAALIATVVQTALTWHDLLRDLRRAGSVLRLDPQGAIWLHAWPSDRPLGPAGQFGIDREELVLRFGAPFPGANRATGLPVGTGAPSARTPSAPGRKDRLQPANVPAPPLQPAPVPQVPRTLRPVA